MWQLFLGSFALSILHALIPNHWLPLVAIAKTEQWSTRETLWAAFFTSLAHLASTILIGILIGYIGIELARNYEFVPRIVAPSILVAIGVVFLILDFISRKKHEHNYNISHPKSRTAIILSLCAAMFMTPCLEIEAYYFQAASFGTTGILIVSIVYLIVTISSIISLVYFAFKGITRLNTHFLEHHAKSITGILLIVLGLIGYFVEF